MTDIDTIVSLAKRRGFVYPGSEIYGGLANSWDYGPLGTALKNNLRDWWWHRFVTRRADMVGVDPAIIMNPKVWEASGHLAGFNDVMVDCRVCQARHRVDHLIEEAVPGTKADGLPPEALSSLIRQHDIVCPNCGGRDFTPARKFNLMFRTAIGNLDDASSTVYLRPELAQGLFVNVKNILDSTRVRLPFGIAAVGKVFRNEITPGNFTYRTLEFDLMEFEYLIRPESWETTFDYWVAEQQAWLRELGFDAAHLRLREHTKEELSHYSQRTADVEYQTSFGWKELFGCAYRTDFDLKNHMEKSGQDLRYTDPETKERFIPHVIEPTFGLTRLTLMTMLEAYREEGEGDDRRIFLKLHPRLAPYKVAVFPLLKNKPDLVAKAQSIADDLRQHFTTAWDDRGNIGKRYYAQDEIGTPFCITVDFQTIDDGTVTVRDRDTAAQERIAMTELVGYINTKLLASPF